MATLGIDRVELQVERRDLGRFLLLARQAGEAVDEGIGNAEVHDSKGDIAEPACRPRSASIP